MSSPLTEQEREIIEAAGCGWVLERFAQKEIECDLLYGDLHNAQAAIRRLEARVQLADERIAQLEAVLRSSQK